MADSYNTYVAKVFATLLVATFLLLASTGVAQRASRTRPATQPSSPRTTPAAAPAVLHYELAKDLVYRTQDGIQVKAFATLSVPDQGIAVLVLESTQDTGRGGPVDRLNESLTLVKGETKRIALFSPGNQTAVMGHCEVLLTLDSRGGLAIGPTPPPPNQPAFGVSPCALNGIFEVRLHAVILKSE